MEEVKLLWKDKREREEYENLAELYAVIRATDKLEKAYSRDLITSSDYENQCFKLIAHFKTLSSSLKHSHSVPNVETFAETYDMDCPVALDRLLTSGLPATVQCRPTFSAFAIHQCTESFITLMDALRMKMVAVDDLSPHLLALSSSLHKLTPTILPPDFEGITKVKHWVAHFSNLKAAHELSDDQSRQLLFDIESSYYSYSAALTSFHLGDMRS